MVNTFDNNNVNFTNATMLSNPTTNDSVVMLLSIDAYNTYIFTHHLIPSFIYVIILLILGIPGNMMVCIYYLTKNSYQKTDRTLNVKTQLKVSDLFIVALAVIDLISCITTMPLELAILWNYAIFDHPWICKISRSVSMFCTVSTSLVLLFIAISRFMGIRMRFGNIQMKQIHAKVIIVISVFVAICLSIPMVLLYGTYRFNLPMYSEQGKTCLVTNEYANTHYPFDLTICLSVFHITFDFIFVLLYGLISGRVVFTRHELSSSIRRQNYIQKQDNDRKSSIFSKSSVEAEQFRKPSNESNTLQGSLPAAKDEDQLDEVFTIEEEDNKSKKLTKLNDKNESFQRRPIRRKRNSPKLSNSKSEGSVHGRIYNPGRTTFIMIIVTVIFMATFAPYCVIALMRSLNPGQYHKFTDVEKALYQLFLRSYFLSSAVNPIVYNILNQDFRQRCKAMIKNVFVDSCRTGKK